MGISFKIAVRRLMREKQFSILNITGLAIAFAAAMLLFLWVQTEYKVDKFHKNGDQLYQVMQNVPEADKSITTMEHTPHLLGQAMQNELPEVAEAITIKSPDEDENPTGILSHAGISVKGSELYVTSNFFRVFSFSLLQGNPKQPFPNQQGVILSKHLAEKLFPHEKNVLGKLVNWNRGQEQSGNWNGTYEVTGIVEAPSNNSSLKFDLLFAQEQYAQRNKEYVHWGYNNPATYVLLKKGTKLEVFNRKTRDFLRKKLPKKWVGTLFAQKFSEKYLHNHYESGSPQGGRIEYLKLFSLIAIFILVIACINFMNLATAKANQSIKGFGIRKAIGAKKMGLMLQIWCDSLLMTTIGMILALGLVMLALPLFSQISGKLLSIPFDLSFFAFLLGLTFSISVLAGIYPAFYLASFHPLKALKGVLKTQVFEIMARKGLIVFQFSIAIVLIIAVLMVSRQTNLILSKNLGFKKENIIRFANEGKIQAGLSTFLSEVKNLPGVANASAMQGDLVGSHTGGGGIDWEGKTTEVGIEFDGLYVDFDWMETLGLEMQEGRRFSRAIRSDSQSIIFNQAAITAMGLKNPIGKTISLYGQPKVIIGVVKDFHYESLYNQIKPFFLSYNNDYNNNILVKIEAGQEQKVIEKLGEFYHQYTGGLAFEYHFIDDDFQKLYAAEQMVVALVRYFAGIAILISCLGLFGLATFSAHMRRKEIGIRKVLGASVALVTRLLAQDFLKLVLIAIVVATPIAWYLMDTWLTNFAYRIQIQWWMFALAGVMAIGIAFLTIGFQSVKAALANPVKSLRSE